MQSDLSTAVVVADSQSGISWRAIVAGAVATAAFSLVLIALGAGLGLSAVSPWSETAISASTFKIATGIYVVIIAVMSSAIGGYLAARLQTPRVGLHSNEVFFRDTAHGLLAWALATVLSASVLGGAVSHLAGGAAAEVTKSSTQSGQSANPQEIYVDKLFRTNTPAGSTAQTSPVASAGRAEVLRLWMSSFGDNRGLAPTDQMYVAGLVAAQTGLSQADSQKRVDDVISEAKAAADQARRDAAQLSLWLTAALLFGAFAASLAAVEGGQLRDGTWNGEVLVLRHL